MIAQKLKQLYDIKSGIKESIKYISGETLSDNFAEYPGKIRKYEYPYDNSVLLKFIEDGPETVVEKENKKEIWSTYKCIFDTDNEHLYLKEYLRDDVDEEAGNIMKVRVADDCTSITLFFPGLSTREPINIECEPGSIVTIEFEEPLTNCSAMFYTQRIVEVLKFPDTSKVTDMNNMFAWCYETLKKLDLTGLNTSNVTDMSCFCTANWELEELNLGNIDTKNVENFNGAFCYNTKLKTIDLSVLDTRNATNMSQLFMQGGYEEIILNCNIENCTDLSDMFNTCNNLHSLDLGNFNMISVENTDGMFYMTSKLTNVTGIISNLKVSLNFAPVWYGTAPLTRESALVFINGTVPVDTTETLTFSNQTYSQLTDQDIAIATARGWSVVAA